MDDAIARAPADTSSPDAGMRFRIEVQPKWSTSLWAKLVGIETDRVAADRRASAHTAATGQLARVIPEPAP